MRVAPPVVLSEEVRRNLSSSLVGVDAGARCFAQPHCAVGCRRVGEQADCSNAEGDSAHGGAMAGPVY